MPDRVSAELAAIREREQAATPGPSWFDGAEAMWIEYWPNAADVAFIVAARSDVPRLLAVVEAVRAIHRPDGEMCVDAIWCVCCGVETDWPCPTIAAITRALTGEDKADGR